MTEMVERVARALWDLDQSRTASRPVFFTDMNATMFGNEWSGKKVPWDHVVGPHVIARVAEEWREAARAAIAAMREPTEAMIEACNRAAFAQGGGAIVLRPVWDAMIDAALA